MAETAGTRSSRKTKEGLFKEPRTNIKGPESARKWLIENDLIVGGNFHGIKTLTSALLQLSLGKFSQLKEMMTRMRAIALCTEEIVQTRHTTEALDMVIGRVEDFVKEVIGGLLGGGKDSYERSRSEDCKAEGCERER